MNDKGASRIAYILQNKIEWHKERTIQFTHDDVYLVKHLLWVNCYSSAQIANKAILKMMGK